MLYSGNTKNVDRYIYNLKQKALFRELLKNTFTLPDEEKKTLGGGLNCWQVVIYDDFRSNKSSSAYSLAELLRIIENDENSYEMLRIDKMNVMILKGRHTIRHFERLIAHLNADLPPEKNSSLGELFFACGLPVEDIRFLRYSFVSAISVFMKRFYAIPPMHVISYPAFAPLPADCVIEPAHSDPLSSKQRQAFIDKYSSAIASNVQLFNRNKLSETFNAMAKELTECGLDEENIKYIMIDLYMEIRGQFKTLYSGTGIPFKQCSAVCTMILNAKTLHEIIKLFKDSLDSVMSAIGYSSRDSIIDDVIYYVEHNYTQNLTLENIAPIFGYNSSYLGKIFFKKTGKRLNSFLDEVRIERAKDMLSDSKIQVYKVAEMVGYRTVDYFHVKFKKYTGMSPMEFRKEKTGV